MLSPVVARRIGVPMRRAAAGLAAGSAGLHTWAMVEHPPATAVSATLLGAMVVGCLYCARHLWRRGSVRDWAIVAMMSAGMLVLHSATMGSGSGHHAHHGAPTSAGHHEAMSTVMGAATLTAVVELLLAVAVVFHATHRAAVPQLRQFAAGP
ncbi:hypothetical protein [Antrihabitans sp. YC2-6]|uniref:hypothetical protein n=1 Tax=Antrihabitans sp. YC2-6 TaxID=2799498 RepID=UPI0027DBF496|nr:hypothetical protein [Antrihabitans sp. YC2-6]